MSRKDVGSRRLDLPAALGAAVRALPRLWFGGAGALVLCAVLALLPRFVGLSGWERPAWAGATAIASLIAVGALARLSIVDDIRSARSLGLGPAGLQFGAPERRLLGAALLCLIFLAMIMAVLALVVLAIFGTADLDIAAIQARDWGRVGEPWKLGVLAVLATVAAAIPILLIVRLSLFVPATLGRRQMVSLNSMGIAYGSVWPLIAGLVLTALPGAALGLSIALELIRGEIAAILSVAVLTGLQLPLVMGFLGAAYRQLEYWSPAEPKS